jgi:hypothetical protein
MNWFKKEENQDVIKAVLFVVAAFIFSPIWVPIYMIGGVLYDCLFVPITNFIKGALDPNS